MRKAQFGYSAGMKGWMGWAEADNCEKLYMHLASFDEAPQALSLCLVEALGKLAPGGEAIVMFPDARKASAMYMRGQLEPNRLKALAFNNGTALDEALVNELLTKAGFIGVTLMVGEVWPYCPTIDPIYGVMSARKPR